METKAVKSPSAAATSWGGQFELQNNLGIQVSYLFVMHSVKVIGPTVGGPYTLENNQSTPALSFTTTSGESDWWFVSFTDVHGVLWTAQLHYDYHESSAGTVVELAIGRDSSGGLGIFTVTIGGKAQTAKFNQDN